MTLGVIGSTSAFGADSESSNLSGLTKSNTMIKIRQKKYETSSVDWLNDGILSTKDDTYQIKIKIDSEVDEYRLVCISDPYYDEHTTYYTTQSLIEACMHNKWTLRKSNREIVVDHNGKFREYDKEKN